MGMYPCIGGFGCFPAESGRAGVAIRVCDRGVRGGRLVFGQVGFVRRVWGGEGFGSVWVVWFLWVFWGEFFGFRLLFL